MPPIQTTYGRTQAEGVPGGPASMSGWDADSRIVETDAGIGFGLAVSRGTAQNQIVLGGADFIGVTYRDVTKSVLAGDKYVDKSIAGVCVRGDIFVTVTAAVVAGDSVLYSPTTGLLGTVAGTRIPSARYIKGAAAGGLALLRLGDAASPDDAI